MCVFICLRLCGRVCVFPRVYVYVCVREFGRFGSFSLLVTTSVVCVGGVVVCVLRLVCVFECVVGVNVRVHVCVSVCVCVKSRLCMCSIVN